MKTPFQRIAAINLAVVLGMAVVLRLLNRGRESELGFLIMMAFALGIHLFHFAGARAGQQKPGTHPRLLAEPAAGAAHWFLGACIAGASFSL